MKVLTKIITLSAALCSLTFAEMPEALSGTWVIDSEGTTEFMKTSPKYDEKAAKYLPKIITRMSKVTYTFENDQIVAKMGDKEKALDVTHLKSEGNTHTFESTIGDKTMTITATINDKGQLNIKNSASNDGDYFLWKKGELDSSKKPSDEQLAIEILKEEVEAK
jgi:hypothetical protein